jgi:hypothetical protein
LEYRPGDLNGDGVVNMADANLLSSILDNSTSINAAVAESRARALMDVILNGLLHNGFDNYNDIFIYGVIDINGDGVVTSADITQISNCFMATILGLEPQDLGCVPGIGETATMEYIDTITIYP